MTVTNTTNTAVPQLSTPFVDTSGIIAIPWYQLLVDLWRKTGSGYSSTPEVAYWQYSEGVLTAYSPAGQAIVPGAAAPQDLGSSPFVFTAPQAGTLVCSAGTVSISRDGGNTYYSAGTAGGAIPLQGGDLCKVAWSESAPTVAWLPTTS